MKIRDVAKRAGVSHQAIYKRLKARGIRAESIVNKATGELTAEGVALMLELYPQKRDEQPQPATPPPQRDAAAVEALSGEVERLREALSNAESRIVALTEERDFLRRMLEQSQDTAALRARIEALEAHEKAARAQALTDGSERRRGGLLSWIRGRGRERGTGEG